jgi:hypothetical protein
MSQLRTAWTFPLLTGNGILEATPIVVDGVMHVSGCGNTFTARRSPSQVLLAAHSRVRRAHVLLAGLRRRSRSIARHAGASGAGPQATAIPTSAANAGGDGRTAARHLQSTPPAAQERRRSGPAETGNLQKAGRLEEPPRRRPQARQVAPDVEPPFRWSKMRRRSSPALLQSAQKSGFRNGDDDQEGADGEPAHQKSRSRFAERTALDGLDLSDVIAATIRRHDDILID